MSVVGFDFGNDSCIISCCRKRVVDVLQNEIGNRKSRSLVVMTNTQRFLGDQGTSQMMSNYKNSITMFKRLLGVDFESADIKETLGLLPFQAVQMQDGSVGVRVQYLSEKHDFTMEQVCGMMFTKLRQSTETSLQKPVSDCVISVPPAWCQDRRRKLMAAAKIAGLNVLKLMNETTAVALTYGILRPLPKDTTLKVMFLDVGASKTSCSCVEFKSGQLEVLSSHTVTNCGGWYFDAVVAKHLAADILQRYKLDVMSNPKALMKLFKESERVKKNLSANTVVNWAVEYIMDGTDVSGKMTREAFEQLIQPSVMQILPCIQRVMEDCGIQSATDLHAVEIVGGASRIPIVQTALREFLGRELSKTCDSDEAVARGCALQCAMLSPLVQVVPFSLKDRTQHDISVSYADLTQGNSNSMDVGMEDAGVVFKRGDLIPRQAIVEVPANYTEFELVAYYSDAERLPPSTKTNLARFVVSNVPKPSVGDDRKLKTKVTLMLTGSDLVAMDGVHFLEEIVEEKPAEGENKDNSAPADGDAAKGGDKKAEDAKDEIVEPPSKKTKYARTKLTYTTDFQGVTPAQAQDFFERELKMINTDRVVRETSDMRNELESYVLEMRTKLRNESDLAPYCTEEEANNLVQRMDKEEEWLDEDGFDAQKSEYKTHLGDLYALCGPVLTRQRQHQKREPAIKALKQVINHYSRWAQDDAANDEKFAHIDQEKLNSVLGCCTEADQWLLQLQVAQDKLALNQDVALTFEALDKKRKDVDRFCNGVRNTPKPKPPTPPPAEEKPAETPEAKAAEGGADNSTEEGGANNSNAEPQPAAENSEPAAAMDTEP